MGGHIHARHLSNTSVCVFVDREGGTREERMRRKSRTTGSKGECEGRNGMVETAERQR